MKHSLGPWRVVFSQKNGAALRVESSERSDVPGAVVSVVRQNGIGMPACDIGHTNARLIAAAPDMLAALREIDAMPASMVNDSENLRHTIKTIQYIARTAIDKAEGSPRAFIEAKKERDEGWPDPEDDYADRAEWKARR